MEVTKACQAGYNSTMDGYLWLISPTIHRRETVLKPIMMVSAGFAGHLWNCRICHRLQGVNKSICVINSSGNSASFGNLLNHHPHCHALTSLGVFTRDGVFHPVPEDIDFDLTTPPIYVPG